tara:strand:- start:33 stop:353 length:321 start_codon:yes stop_codon:yes gene_type:complete
VVEYAVANGVTRVRFPVSAYLVQRKHVGLFKLISFVGISLLLILINSSSFNDTCKHINIYVDAYKNMLRDYKTFGDHYTQKLFKEAYDKDIVTGRLRVLRPLDIYL